MSKIGRRLAQLLIGLCAALAFAGAADAGVVVTTDGDTAIAEISLDDANGHTYTAEVTITFDSVQNLSPRSLNLTAELVDPNDAALAQRLPAGMSLDPAFPMLITIEPPELPALFASGFEDRDGGGVLTFLNTYQIEVHTADLQYADGSPYRLLKAPVGDAFDDVTSDVLAGSVRTRGRGGAFSQFLVAKDSATTLVPLLLTAVGKLTVLQLDVVAAALDDVLRLDLLGLIADISADLVLVVLDVTAALASLDQFIAEVTAHAGTDIPNVWSADHSVDNKAGQMLQQAQTLRFTLVRMQTAPLL
ncbi:MAG TPA: DUF6689 family protein [Dokdonella sp.]